MSNRVLHQVLVSKNEIENRLKAGLITVEQLEETRKNLDFSIDEYVKFQEMKSLAVATSIMTLEEGTTIYEYLGNSVEKFNGQPIEVKLALTQIFVALIKKAA